MGLLSRLDGGLIRRPNVKPDVPMSLYCGPPPIQITGYHTDTFAYASEQPACVAKRTAVYSHKLRVTGT